MVLAHFRARLCDGLLNELVFLIIIAVDLRVRVVIDIVDIIGGGHQLVTVLWIEAPGDVGLLILVVRVCFGHEAARPLPQGSILRLEVLGDLLRRLDEVEQGRAIGRLLVERLLIAVQLRQLVLSELGTRGRWVGKALLEELRRVHVHLVVCSDQGAGRLCP